MRNKRWLAALVALLLMTSMATGVALGEELEYPETLSIFCWLSEHIAKTGATDFNDSYLFQEMEKITGTHVEWVHPPAGSDADAQINLMVSSGNLPDIVVRKDWKNFSGGPAVWDEDGVIYDLTELIPEYMPNYYEAITTMPYAMQDLSIDGKLYYISEIGAGLPYYGPIYRGDWLDALNIKAPETVDELYEALVAFHDKDPNGNDQQDEWAMSDLEFTGGAFGAGNLLWAFGITHGFMQIDGQVTYGPLEPAFTDAMAFMNKLYTEGLLDPDYTTQDRDMLDGKFMNNLVGFEYGIQPTKMNNALAETGFKAVGGPNLKRDADSPAYVFDTMYISYVAPHCDAVITTECEEPGKALHWLDYFYGEEGVLLTNFGIEGMTYRMEDGKPVWDFTGALALDPDATESDLRHKYTLMSMSVLPIRSGADAYYTTLHPYSADAISLWSEINDVSRLLPNVSLTPEETESINDVLVDIETYIEIQLDRLVTGQASLDEIPNIQARLRDMGIEDCIAIYQAAYERYQAQ